MSVQRVEVVGGLPDGLTPYWTAFEYPTDEAARAAWEDANRQLEGVSVWRFKNPPHLPARFFCFGLGERRENVEKTEALLRVGSSGEFDAEPSLIVALCARRYRTALEARGNELRQESRTPEGRRLTKDGRMVPYEPPEDEGEAGDG